MLAIDLLLRGHLSRRGSTPTSARRAAPPLSATQPRASVSRHLRARVPRMQSRSPRERRLTAAPRPRLARAALAASKVRRQSPRGSPRTANEETYRASSIYQAYRLDSLGDIAATTGVTCLAARAALRLPEGCRRRAREVASGWMSDYIAGHRHRFTGCHGGFADGRDMPPMRRGRPRSISLSP